MPEDNFLSGMGNESLDKLRDKASSTIEGLKKQYGLNGGGTPWPQTETPSGDLQSQYPNYTTRGFLPPILISPSKDFKKDKNNEDPEAEQSQSESVVRKFGEYTYTDWRGQKLNLAEDNGGGVGDTKSKFDLSKDLPKSKSTLTENPYSIRDYLLLQGESSMDYFRHGLQVIDNLNTIQGPEFWDTQKSKETASRTSLGSFTGTPFENNDPVMFGFDIIIDDVSSPLLNGSISDFLQQFRSISEIGARIPVYEEFKQQFIKIFKTKATVRIDDNQTSITKMRNSSYADSDNSTGLYSSGKKAYLNYYLKKIAGLEKLIESNTPTEKNFLADYGKDIITLSFSEDVSLSLGTLTHLYKLLYWSKPNGKTMVPENLLRFNCDIVISEVRNFNRVRKAISTGDIEVVKDNVSRYIYSLKECQFYFNTMPHEGEVDLASIKAFDTYNVIFDYKYSSVKFERFVPDNKGFGQYVGYDNGAIWKIGNQSRNGQAGTVYDKSVPKFFTTGTNKYNQNGVESPIVLSMPGKSSNLQYDNSETESQNLESGDVERPSSGFDNFKQKSKEKAKDLKNRAEDTLINSLTRESQTFINTRVGILNQSLNKILNAQGLTGIRPPKNIYTDKAPNAVGRIFYDVRGQLLDFIGNSFGNVITGN